MTANKVKSRSEITATLIDSVCRRLAQRKRVRRTLPQQGRLHVDRQLPFLCVYRRPADEADPGTEQLVKGEAAYLIAPGSAQHAGAVSRLVQGLAQAMAAEFGAFLIVEIWSASGANRIAGAAPATTRPQFELVSPPAAALAQTVDLLARRLSRIRVNKQAVAVNVVDRHDCEPDGMQPLLAPQLAADLHCAKIGLIVPPVYRDPHTGHEFPLLLRQLRRSLGLALKQTFYDFAHSQTTHRPPHFHELGRRAVVKAVWEIDRQLGEVSNAFDFLLQLTPVNSDEAWHSFRKSHFCKVPQFRYPPLPFDPPLLKRQLYRIPIERVEDPALQHIFYEKQLELDRKISMLAERDTPQFLYGSLQHYGGVDEELLKLATELFQRLQPTSGGKLAQGFLGAEALAARARAEFDYYRAMYPDFRARTEITRRVAGILVSRGRMLIHPRVKISASRVDALLQHEVGTHLLSYYNGRAQPFRQLYSGLAGYEAAQEGLAVLAEYLVGGLDRPRLRQLAARVIVARQCIEGASFADAFRHLVDTAQFSPKSAFKNTMRLFRGGGLTKDAVYLRGLREILAYLACGGHPTTLLVGKMAVSHVPIVKELLLRQVLRPPPLRPRYLDNPLARQKLEDLRTQDTEVLDIVAS
jgi:uncharacterized protein (TIGR02421 family)